MLQGHNYTGRIKQTNAGKRSRLTIVIVFGPAWSPHKKTNSQLLEELRNTDQQEKQVEKVFELVEEHDWEEAKNCISLVVNSIVWDTSKHKVEIVEFYCADL